ncbi:hypothetical protein OPT61_g5766 [Boeremia exigua]|uniref:Uncharacterized protein n=1 Tax=Boeremia exigua TaxID=749465 RepID=A0ACC2I938_9PLEO|nr:hypothetical protein OPT61_g5766 [Boeremia exigua]
MSSLRPDDKQSPAGGADYVQAHACAKGDKRLCIVFVHGLQGHPRKTWTKRISGHRSRPPCSNASCTGHKPRSRLRFWKSNSQVASVCSSSNSSLTKIDSRSNALPYEVFWPQDLLPSDRPDVRILTWGYDTVITKGWQRANKNNLFAHARDFMYALERERPYQRPLIFVAHSLGGIMVKEVLRRSETSTEQGIFDILSSTAAIIFMGTPHRGSPGLANLGEIVRRTASTVLRVDSNAAVLRTLGCDSPELELCRESFTAQWRRYNFRVKTIQEALPIGGVGIGRFADKVVPDTSSSLDDAREHAETISANHMEMARFSGPEDVGYQKIAGEIRIVIESLYRLCDQQPVTIVTPPSTSPTVVPRSLLQPFGYERLQSSHADDQGVPQLLVPYQHHELMRPRIVELPAPVNLSLSPSPATSTGPASRPRPALSALEIECLQFLSFDQLGARQDNIKPELEGTCTWIFDHPAFREWEDRRDAGTHKGMLWIKGKPGAGKSVIMKKLLRTVEDRELPNSIVASFFFNARGADLERNTTGMTQSLLHQLLQQHSGMRQNFVQFYSKRKQAHSQVILREIELRNHISRYLSMPVGKPVFLFIDALDECKEDEVREVVSYLRELTDAAYEAGNVVNVCMSSRRYPTISVSRCPEIDVEEGNRADVTRYVYKKICAHADGSVPELLAVLIDSKASHVFLWAVLVVEMVLRGWDSGVPFPELEEMLQSIPQEIDQVFDGLSHTLTNEERPETVRLFQWVLLAASPLNMGPLKYALVFGRNEPPSSFTAVHTMEGQFKHQQLIRQITHYSRGLIEVIRKCNHSPDLKCDIHDTYLVQVIHESVRDWFFSGGGFCRLDPSLGPNPIAKGHLQIIRTCMSVMTAGDFREMHPLRVNVTCELSQQKNCVGTYWSSNDVSDGIGPNLSNRDDVMGITRYCADFIFHHAKEAENYNMVPESFLSTLSEPNSKLWTTLLDVVTEDIVLRFHPIKHNVLTLLCRKGLKGSVAWVIENVKDHRAKDLHCNAIRAAILGEHLSTLEVLSQYKPINTMTDSNGRSGLHWTCEIFAVGTYELLKDNLHDILTFFLKGGNNIDTKDNNGMTGLMIIAENGGGDAVKVLLDLGAHLDERDHRGRTALHIAVERDHHSPTGALLGYGASAEVCDNDGQTPLHKAAAMGHDRLIDWLLKSPSSLDIQDSTSATPLHLAALSGNGQIVCKLVLAGADVNLADETGQTPLHIAARKISQGTLEIMLDSGADRTLKDRFGMTAADHAEATLREQSIIDLLDAD